MRFLRLTVFVAACSLGWSARSPEWHQHTQQSADSDTALFLLQTRLLQHKKHTRPADRRQVSVVGPKLKVAWPRGQKLKVVYGVFTSPLAKYAEQMAAVEDTWAKDVPPQKLLVVGVNGSNPSITYKLAPNCKDGHVQNSGISCKEATLLVTGHELGADWVVVVGSDNYVLPRNMEEKLAKADAKKAQILAIFGCGDGKYCEDHLSGMCGGGGYAISRAALDKMVGKAEGASQSFIAESMHTARTVGGYWSDQVTSCIARRHGVEQVQLAGLYGWKLCPNDLSGLGSCPLDKKSYREKLKSWSPKALTFHYIEPSEMRVLHKLVKGIEGKAALGGRAQVSLTMKSSTRVNNRAHYRKQRAAYIDSLDQSRHLLTHPFGT